MPYRPHLVDFASVVLFSFMLAWIYCGAIDDPQTSTENLYNSIGSAMCLGGITAILALTWACKRKNFGTIDWAITMLFTLVIVGFVGGYVVVLGVSRLALPHFDSHGELDSIQMWSMANGYVLAHLVTLGCLYRLYDGNTWTSSPSPSRESA